MGVILKSSAIPPPTKLMRDVAMPKFNKQTMSGEWITVHPAWYPAHDMPPAFGSTLNQGSKAPGLENERHDSTSEWYYYKPTGRLWDLCENISKFRREGKNRRDTATVSSRVLRLCRQATYWVFDPSGRKAPHLPAPKL